MTYLQYVDSLPCCVCGHTGDNTHHHLMGVSPQFLRPLKGEDGLAFPRMEGRGMGKKNPDRFCVPVCAICHIDMHAYGRDYEAESLNGFPEAYALRIYKSYMDAKK